MTKQDSLLINAYVKWCTSNKTFPTEYECSMLIGNMAYAHRFLVHEYLVDTFPEYFDCDASEKIRNFISQSVLGSWISLFERQPSIEDADSLGCIMAYSECMNQITVCAWHCIWGDGVTTHWRSLPAPPKADVDCESDFLPF